MADYNLGHVVGATGNGITSIEKISTSGLVDTYQINFTDGTSTTFEVTNGQDGTGGVDIVTSWESTLSDEKIPSEKLTKNTIDTKLDKVHSSYKGKNVVTNSSTGAIEFENKPSIPSKTSDLTNDGSSSSDSLVYVETSATSGLIKNDGTIDTNSYITSSSISGKEDTSNKVTSWTSTTTDTHYPSEKLVKDSLDDKISKSSTSGLVKNDGTIDTSTYLTQLKVGTQSGVPIKTGSNGVLTGGSFGTSSGTFAEGNHTHSGMLTTSDIVDNLTTNDSTKVLSAKQGKALNDLIGAAISYINQ